MKKNHVKSGGVRIDRKVFIRAFRYFILLIMTVAMITDPFTPVVMAVDSSQSPEEKAEATCEDKYSVDQAQKDACKDGYLNGSDENFCDKYTVEPQKNACKAGVTAQAEANSPSASNPIYSPQTPGLNKSAQQGNFIPFYDQTCDPNSSSASASGATTELTFPRNLDDGKMADAINAYIEENKSADGSILEGVGETAVKSAKQANVNPFLIIAQSKHESGLGSKSDYNVRNGNNSFGRMATPSQPHFSGSRLWYKWSSGEASVDADAAENKAANSGKDQYSYVRDMFAEELDAGDWGAYFERYAPVSDGNANPIYHPSDGSKPLVQQEVEKMAADAGGSGGNNGATTAGVSNDTCCAPSTTGAISGDTNVAKLMSYLTGKGLSVEIAAGFAGNFMQESGGGTFDIDPKIVSPSGYKGIAQWDAADRYPKLVQLKGAEAETIEGQIWYVGYELGLEQDPGSGRYARQLDAIKQADTVEDATRLVAEHYEGYTGELDKRTEYAKKAFETYGDGAVVPATNGSSGSCDEGGAAGDFVYYNQNDPELQDGLCIAPAGCGPTSIAMIIATKKDKNVKPADVARFLQEKGLWNCGIGITWTGFAAAGEKWGMTVTDIGRDWNKAKEALKAGKLMTLSGTGSDPFTSGGHIVAARGVTDDGKIIIANPAPMNDTPEQTPYTTAELDGAGFANMWIFE